MVRKHKGGAIRFREGLVVEAVTCEPVSCRVPCFKRKYWEIYLTSP
jgi:hypothetical protein